MKIKKIEWRNVASYGNKVQKLELPDSAGLIQVVGENGVGKCFFPDTRIIIKIPDSPEFRNKIKKYLLEPLSPSDI
jgi:hypothetical protein